MNARNQTVAQAIATAFVALQNCERRGNSEWAERWTERIEYLCANFLPSGSGWDCGTKFDYESSREDRLVFTGSYHHMHDSGMYDGWTDHAITVRPAFDGLSIKVSGRDRNEIKDYLAEQFDYALSQQAPEHVVKQAA